MKVKKTAVPTNAVLFTFFNEIGIIAQLCNSMFERRLPDGLSNSQFGVLNWFTRVDNEATPGRLATAFQVTGGAMTYTLKKMAAQGLIKIEPDANSGRKKRVTITRKGLAVREQAIKAAAPLFEEFAEVLSAAKIGKQVKELQKIRQYLDELRFQKNRL